MMKIIIAGVMKSFLVLVTLSSTLSVALFGQVSNHFRDINNDVWIPFMQTYANLDSEGFMEIHTGDVIRIVRDGRTIRVGEEYAEDMRQSSERNQARGLERTIEFRFLERIARDELAFEVGYYKVVSKRPDRQPQTSYGKFHVLLVKEEGRWKIHMDSDTSMEDSIDEKIFQKGKSMESY